MCLAINRNSQLMQYFFNLILYSCSLCCREIVGAALSVYIEQGIFKVPLQCLDLSVKGIEGPSWSENHGNSVIVQSSESKLHGPGEKKDYSNSETVESHYSLIERTDFNFM